jgi:type IV pilus assembly protein PilF
MKSISVFAILLVYAALEGCVSQTTIQSQTPDDKPAKSDATQRAQAHTGLSGAYFQRGQLAVALDEARMALKERGDYVPAFNMLGLIYMELRDDAQATANFEQALRLSPGDSEVFNNYGWFLCSRGKQAKAMEYFQSALKNPLYSTPERAYLNAGICARQLGDEAEAERNLRLALQIQPLLGPALYQMADISYKRVQLKDAISFLTRYNRATPNPTVEALFLGVQVSRALGDKSSEDSYVQQLKRRFPEASETRLATENR